MSNLLRTSFALVTLVACVGSIASAHATTYTSHENWERLTFLPGMGENYRIYSPQEFTAAIPEWRVYQSSAQYGVEHQHSHLTWGQRGTNDDFLELDVALDDDPQIFTTLRVGPDEYLSSLSLSFDVAARPDIAPAVLDFFGIKLHTRRAGDSWRTQHTFGPITAAGPYPVFETLMYQLTFGVLDGPYEIGFSCYGCALGGSRLGYGILLGDVRISYDTGSYGNGGGAPVPEPGTLLLLSSALFALKRRA